MMSNRSRVSLSLLGLIIALTLTGSPMQEYHAAEKSYPYPVKNTSKPKVHQGQISKNGGDASKAGSNQPREVSGTSAGFDDDGPPLLSIEELTEIAKQEKRSPYLEAKLNRVLNTPFIYRYASLGSNGPSPLKDETLGDFTRFTSWNIERGFELAHIISLLKGKVNVTTNQDKAASKAEQALDEQRWLAASQVLLLSEVDFGMKRTDYKNVTLELAKALKMHAAYGVEFLELAPLTPWAKEHAKQAAKEMDQDPELKALNLGEELNIDPNRYLGMHGLAVLSKYPILKTRIIRLPVCYDWFKGEQDKVSALEKVKRKAADTVFLETVLTEVRAGGRMALAVDLATPQLPEGKITVVASHLENRTPPDCRRTQFNAMVNALQDVKNPVVIGGDWNTTGNDVSPTSIRKEVRVRAKSPTFWTRKAVALLAPYGFAIHLGMNVTEYVKNWHDPASVHVPLVAPNREKGLFDDLEAFTFLDGKRFDLRGDRQHSVNGRMGFMANSNERVLKGFAPTFMFQRSFKGVLGEFKLDWFAVKSYLTDPKEKNGTYRFAPVRGRTLWSANRMFGEPLSDHSPITVDLPFQEPPVRTQ